MVQYSGFIFIIDEEERAKFITDRVKRGEPFTDTLSVYDWRTEDGEIFLLSLDSQTLAYAALVEHGNMVATRKHQIKFSEFVSISPALPFSELQLSLNIPLENYFTRSSSGLEKRLPEDSWNALLNILIERQPAIREGLERLVHLQKRRFLDIGKTAVQTMVEERDATNLALRMANIDHEPIKNTPISEQAPAPFLRNLGSVNVREDPFVTHDAHVFGDWQKIREYQIGATEFVKTGERLTIMNVNRSPVEQTTGVDLLYYHHRYRAYVIIQYKRMVKESREWVYRPKSDKSYAEELAKMQTIQTHLQGTVQAQGIVDDFRLHSGLFYFKLCQAQVDDPLSVDMIPGTYVPLDYWEELVNLEFTRGPRDGKRITNKNIRRNFSNTLFVELVQTGWIGSRCTHTDIISEIVQQSIAANKSLTLAALLPNLKRS